MIILFLIILKVKNHSCMGFGAQYYRAMQNRLAQANIKSQR